VNIGGVRSMGWYYPDKEWPPAQQFPHASHNREKACPRCGAPPRAACVNRYGVTVYEVHKARVSV